MKIQQIIPRLRINALVLIALLCILSTSLLGAAIAQLFITNPFWTMIFAGIIWWGVVWIVGKDVSRVEKEIEREDDEKFCKEWDDSL